MQQPEVKLALLTLATKLFALPNIQAPDQLRLLGRYLFLLARYDGSYDVRDRARFLRGLVRGLLDEGSADDEDAEDGTRDVGGVVLRQEQISLVVGGSKQPIAAASVKQRTSDAASQQAQWSRTDAPCSGVTVPHAEFGTASALTQPHFLPGYMPFFDWKEEGTDPSLRDPPPSLGTPAYTPLAPTGPSSLKGFGSDSFGASSNSGFSSRGSGGRPTTAATSAPSSGRRGEVDLNKFYESSRCVPRTCRSIICLQIRDD